MNLILIHGRLAREPEFTAGAEPSKDRTNFTVASNRRFGDEADFLDCVIFGKRAGVISKFFHTGSEIVFYGELQTNVHPDKQGNKRKYYSVVAMDFEFCGSKKSEQGSNKPEYSEEKTREALEASDSLEQAEEDIPF